MNPPLLEIDRLSFSYPPSKLIFANVSAGVGKSSFTLIRGASGSGKSTLLRLLCRLEQPDSGEIRYGGVPIQSIDPPQLRRKVCYVQQTPTLIDGTVKDNLLLPFGFKLNRNLEKPSDNLLTNRLAQFHLDGIDFEQPAMDLSVGQKQRVCLLRAMLIGPDVLLLDEPTSALDPESESMVFELTETLNRREGVSILMVTHEDYRPAKVSSAVWLCHNRSIELQ
jgi:putative ABC transport system ATP-binding protein